MSSVFSWNEGRWLDLWTLVHIAGGVVSGLFFQVINMPLGWAIATGLIAATLWEIREHYVGVGEVFANSVLDIMIAALASYSSYMILKIIPEMYWLEIFFTSVTVWVFLGYFGYKHYHNK